MFITAERIHDGNGWLPPGSTIEVSPDGVILSILPAANEQTIRYEGVLTPGFVNVHCHLELSHMKGIVPERTGLIPFLKTIPRHRNDHSDEQKKEARHNAYRELVANGVVAVGDIANTTDTLDLRELDEMHFHTFVEAIGFNDHRAAIAFDYASKTHTAFSAQRAAEKLLRQTIVPHAPYSVSASLFRLISDYANGCVLSIHNQESREEDRYFMSKEGGVQDLLHTLGIDDSRFSPSGKSSVQTYMEWLSRDTPMIFVHNTYTSAADIRYVLNRTNNSYWCLCPNANLYIENTLPAIDTLIAEGAKMCIGTDSLASNHQLSILSELQAIKKQFDHIDWGTLLTWATRNGAEALQMDGIIGTIAPGKKPGIVQLTGGWEQGREATIERIF